MSTYIRKLTSTLLPWQVATVIAASLLSLVAAVALAWLFARSNRRRA